MNEQLQQALASILNKTMAGVEAGASFLQAEIPDVIQQLLIWKLAQDMLYVGFALAAAAAYWKLIKVFMKAPNGSFMKTSYGMAEIPAFLGFMFGGIATLGFGIAGFISLLEALQIWLAPKIYLIEYAASLAK